MSDETRAAIADFVRDPIAKQKILEELSLQELINDREWPLVGSRIQTHPEEVVGFVDSRGRTILHQLCQNPPTPDDIFFSVIQMYPEAVKMSDNKYGVTPLHVLCWSSPGSIQKVQILLECLEPKDMMVRNRSGETVLHSAAGSRACLPVLKQIVDKMPSIVAEHDNCGDTAVATLWYSHFQTIPASMQIARMLTGDDVNEDQHFEASLEKLVFLASESFKLSVDYPVDTDPNSINYVLHSLLKLQVPSSMLLLALCRYPNLAAFPDANGNYPLHRLVGQFRRFTKDSYVVSKLILAYPEAARRKNKSEDLPLFIAIRNGMAWEEGLNGIVRANPDVLGATDKGSGFYPFLLAASLGGDSAMNTIYQLLLSKPEIVKEVITHQQRNLRFRSDSRK